MKAPFPDGIETVFFGLGCFWGAERKFWQIPEGIWVTAVGYAGGVTPNPSYEEVCTSHTGHNEVVLVAFDPRVIPFEQLLKTFWRAMIRPKACARAMMSARNIAQAFM